MTNPELPSPADYRRAAALVVHQRRNDHDGMTAVIDEANTEHRSLHLVLATLSLHGHFIGLLRTKDAGVHMADYVNGLAEDPGTIGRAARILTRHANNNHASLIAEMNNATEAGLTSDTFAKLLAIYDTLLPEITSRTGTAWLQAQIASYLAEEINPE